MILIFTGSKESYEIYEQYVTRSIDFECLQFVSESIKSLDSTHRKIHHIYIPHLGKTRAKAKLKKQHELMAMATIGFAKGNRSDTIVVSTQVTKELDDLAAVNNINVIYPFVENEDK